MPWVTPKATSENACVQPPTRPRLASTSAVMGGWSRDDTLRSGAPGPTFAAAIGPYFGPIWAHVRLGYSTFAHEADRLSYVDATVGAMPVLVAYEPVIL